MSTNNQGKWALITGGTSGIGYELAKQALAGTASQTDARQHDTVMEEPTGAQDA